MIKIKTTTMILVLLISIMMMVTEVKNGSNNAIDNNNIISTIKIRLTTTIKLPFKKREKVALTKAEMSCQGS